MNKAKNFITSTNFKEAIDKNVKCLLIKNNYPKGLVNEVINKRKNITKKTNKKIDNSSKTGLYFPFRTLMELS